MTLDDIAMTDTFSTEDKKKFEIAQEFSKKGDLINTLKILKELVYDNPSSGIMNAMLANTHWELGDLEVAQKYFKTAVELSPSSEKISRGLFHILWEQGDEVSAVNEIQRFISTGNASSEYKEMALEIKSKRGFNIKL